MNEADYRKLLGNMLYSLCLCDHMGDVSEVMDRVIEATKLIELPTEDYRAWDVLYLEALEEAGYGGIWRFNSEV